MAIERIGYQYILKEWLLVSMVPIPTEIAINSYDIRISNPERIWYQYILT